MRSGVFVYGIERKSGHAYGGMPGSSGAWHAVAGPLALMVDNRLPKGYVYCSVVAPYSQHPAENYSVFIEFGGLSGFLPAARAACVGDARLLWPGANPPDIFLDAF